MSTFLARGGSADPIGGDNSTTSDLSELSDDLLIVRPHESLSQGNVSPGGKRDPPQLPLSISTTPRRRPLKPLPLSLDASEAIRSHNNLSTRSQPAQAASPSFSSAHSLYKYRSSPSPSATGSSYFESEAYKQRRNKRLKALKNVRTTFRNILEKRPESTPLEVSYVSSTTVRANDDVEQSTRSNTQGGNSDNSTLLDNPTTEPPTDPTTTEPPPAQDARQTLNQNADEITNPLDHNEINLHDELASAKQLIQMQTHQVRDLKSSLLSSSSVEGGHSNNSSSDSFPSHYRQELIETKRQLAQVQVNRAWEDYEWRQKISENAREHQLQISQYQTEVEEWKDRLKEAEKENQRQIEEMKKQMKEAEDKVVQTQLDIARLVIKHQVALEESQKPKNAATSKWKTVREKKKSSKNNGTDIMSLEVPTNSTDSSSTFDEQRAHKETHIFTTALGKMAREKLRRKQLRSKECPDKAEGMKPSKSDANDISTQTKGRRQQQSSPPRRFGWRKRVVI
jgi:hypothetical protein